MFKGNLNLCKHDNKKKMLSFNLLGNFTLYTWFKKYNMKRM